MTTPFINQLFLLQPCLPLRLSIQSILFIPYTSFISINLFRLFIDLYGLLKRKRHPFWIPLSIPTVYMMMIGHTVSFSFRMSLFIRCLFEFI